MRRLAGNIGRFFAVLLGASLAYRISVDYWGDGGAAGPLLDTLFIGSVSIPFVLVHLGLLEALRRRLEPPARVLRAAAVLLSPVAFYLLLEGLHYEDGLASVPALVAGWPAVLIYGAIVRVAPRE